MVFPPAIEARVRRGRGRFEPGLRNSAPEIACLVIIPSERGRALNNAMRPTMILALLLALAVCWRSTGGAQGSDMPRTPDRAPEASGPLLNFSGIWVGTSTSSADGSKVKIAFNIKRAGNKFKGDYRCAPGNAVCRNNVQRGWVHGQIAARGFTVSEEDTSWCLFFVSRFRPPAAEGEYTCYMNGGIADLGVFELKQPLGE
jgi:hypothetical protein